MNQPVTKALFPAAAAMVLLTAVRLPTPAPQARAYHVTARGTRMGDGSQRRAWDLATALAGGAGKVRPGDTIWVHGGTYKGAFRSTVRGAQGAPVVIRQFRGERATIDGVSSNASTLYVTGDYTVFWGLELTNSNPVRTATSASHDARPDVVVNKANHTKYINLIVHDGGSGFYTEPAFVDVEIAGCIVYNNGWDGPDRGHGHGLYLKSLIGPLVARDNVVFNQYGLGIHAYTNATTGKLINIRLEGNVAFNNGSLSKDRSNPNILLGGAAYASGDVVKDNVAYFPPGIRGANVRIGYKTLLNGDVQVTGNYFAGGDPVLDLGYWQVAVVTDNTLVGSGTSIKRNQSSQAHIFRGNQEERGPGSKVVVRPNPYEPGRAYVIVHNAAQKSISADLSGVLARGDRYEVRSVRDVFGAPIDSGTVGSGSITIRLRDGNAPTPTGLRVSPAPGLGLAFDVLVVSKISAALSTSAQ